MAVSYFLLALRRVEGGEDGKKKKGMIMEFPCRASERREGTSALHSQICKSFPRPNNSRNPVGGGDHGTAAPKSFACKAHRFLAVPENWKANASSRKRRAVKLWYQI